MKRKFKSAIAICLLFACIGSLLVSCGSSATVKISKMTTEELEECVGLCEYKNIEISVNGVSKYDALLSHIMVNSCVKKYPVGTVSYYVEQLKKQYRYYADEAGMRYDVMLDELGEDNLTMKKDARELVKKDLIFELIRRRENITLTETEKSKFFDRYVKKYAEDYKYSEEYVREELFELVYDSMLHDKTMEFLILNNRFVEKTSDMPDKT